MTIDLIDLRIAGPLLILVLGLSLLLGGGRDRPLTASAAGDAPDSASPGDTDDADRATQEVTDAADAGGATDDVADTAVDRDEPEERELDDETSEA